MGKENVFPQAMEWLPHRVDKTLFRQIDGKVLTLGPQGTLRTIIQSGKTPQAGHCRGHVQVGQANVRRVQVQSKIRQPTLHEIQQF
jgi:hypothetical protein